MSSVPSVGIGRLPTEITQLSAWQTDDGIAILFSGSDSKVFGEAWDENPAL